MVSDYRKAADAGTEFRVSIRFEARGGFRPARLRRRIGKIRVSIRFEVRGGFRRNDLSPHRHVEKFQSALRFAVVSDANTVTM